MFLFILIFFLLITSAFYYCCYYIIIYTGLGDIVIPGLFVALLLRFDAVRNKITGINADRTAFSKPYFTVNLVFYAIGLIVTVGVMYFFNAAQPALLYLVPACLGSSLLVALVRGE